MNIGNSELDRRYAEKIKPIRNKMREFNYDSALFEFAKYLNDSPSPNVENLIKRRPWVAERLVVWLLSDIPSMYGMRTMTQHDVVHCIDLAWHMSGDLQKVSNIGDLHLFIRKIIISQAPHQNGTNFGAFGRQLILVSRLEKNSKLRKALEQRAEIGVEVYFELALLFYCLVHEAKWTLHSRFIKSLFDTYGKETVLIFLRGVALQVKTVRKNLRESRVIGMDEWFQPTPLYKYPWVMTSLGFLSWGLPTIRRHFEQVVADWLDTPENTDSKQQWEKLFSDYIGASLERTGCQIWDEKKIQTEFNIQNKKVCDYLVIEHDCVVLIEVKHKALNASFPASGSPGTFRSKLKATVAKGIEQLSVTEEKAMSHPAMQEKCFYSLVVTSGELWLGPGDFLHQREENQQHNKPYIFSADDMDHLCEIIRLGQTSFGAFFLDLNTRNSTPQTSLNSPGMLLHKDSYVLHEAPKHLSDICLSVLNRVAERLPVEG